MTSSFPASQASYRVSFPHCCSHTKVARIPLTLHPQICAWKGKTYRHTELISITTGDFDSSLKSASSLENRTQMRDLYLSKTLIVFKSFHVISGSVDYFSFLVCVTFLINSLVLNREILQIYSKYCCQIVV